MKFPTLRSPWLFLAGCAAALTNLASGAEDTARVLSTSPDKKYELTSEAKDHPRYTLRNTETKKSIQIADGWDDLVNPGFGDPSLDWHPETLAVIVTAQVYRRGPANIAVFRIDPAGNWTRIELPEETTPLRWDEQGRLVVEVKRERTFLVDPKTKQLVPASSAPRRSSKKTS